MLSRKTTSSLNIKSDGIYIDDAAGGGGHSEAIVKRLNATRILPAIDQGPDAIKAVKKRLENYPNVLM